MRNEELYLRDILEACRAVQRFLEGVSAEQFFADELRQSAVLQKLIVIGEAAARLPAAFRSAHPHIEWEDIIGFRNIAVHEYFSILWEIVWLTALEDLPPLSKAIADILKGEFDSDVQQPNHDHTPP